MGTTQVSKFVGFTGKKILLEKGVQERNPYLISILFNQRLDAQKPSQNSHPNPKTPIQIRWNFALRFWIACLFIFFV